MRVCVLCVCCAGVCVFYANKNRETNAMPMRPHNTDSKTVRANVRCCAGAGVCCVRVRVRFMGGWVGGWVN